MPHHSRAIIQSGRARSSAAPARAERARSETPAPAAPGVRPCLTILVLSSSRDGPVAQRQSGRLITGWSQVRILAGPPRSQLDVRSRLACESIRLAFRRAQGAPLVMQPEQVAAYLQHQMPDAREIEVSQLWRIPGGASRETWSFDATWREGKAVRLRRSFILRRDPEASLLETERYAE